MAALVYLDPEDEITSAANRIRHAPDTRVGLVIPFGSRVATSRINFRLLAREAMANGRRLDVVAPDASARALAASAGLAVFASVGEYEEALDIDEAPETPVPAPTPRPVAAAAPGGPRRQATPMTQPGPATAASSAGRRSTPAGAVGGFAPTARSGAAPVPDPARDAELDAIVHRGREVGVRRPARRGGGGLAAGVLLLVFALGVAAIAGYVLLPSATITVTPRIETVGPVRLTVHADPTTNEVDAAAGVIPAQEIAIPLSASGDFPATGKRVEKIAATGGVRWTNCDPTAAYTIPKGTTVKTSGGVAFAIDEQVFLPVAIISGTGSTVNLQCQSSEVAVTATAAGLAGNVPAGAIKVVPSRYNRTVIRVTNPAATTGGAETTYPKVTQKDVDGALASLQGELDAQLADALTAPDLVPAGLTAFPETAGVGVTTPSDDPATLVDTEVPTFTLTLTATATMLAADSSPVAGIVAGRLTSLVSDGWEMVPGSTRVDVGKGTIDPDGTVAFPASATARQQRPVDAAAIKAMVLGMSEREAMTALAPYGEVAIELWPAFASGIPTISQRVTLTVEAPVTVDPSAMPSTAPEGGATDQPLPSE